MLRILLATTNKGKANEYRSLLAGLDIELVTLDQTGIDQQAEENYPTFEENARSKAEFYAALSGLVTLADDSGLEVDALGGEPGVRSSRYAGENATDEDRVNFLLNKLADTPEGKRQARFRCVTAIAEPDGKIHVTEGECRGLIALEPKGENGFGYDPIFYVPEYKKTIAEMPPALKNEISHRGRAAKKALSILESICARTE
ncbi:MAG: XTP/dITP diphosphatase [Dehalococcoidia bacterium]|nr:XTP/dITP diphosphatase [Dehalococcoidia bacterium]